MDAFSVRLPKRYRNRLRELAKKEGVSINQLITLAVGEKLSALDTEVYLSDRGNRGSREKFMAALSKVSDAAPENKDDLID